MNSNFPGNNFLSWRMFFPLQDPRGPDCHWDKKAAPPEETKKRDWETEAARLATAPGSWVCGGNDAFTTIESVHQSTPFPRIQLGQRRSVHLHRGLGGHRVLPAGPPEEAAAGDQEGEGAEDWEAAEHRWVPARGGGHVQLASNTELQAIVLLISWISRYDWSIMFASPSNTRQCSRQQDPALSSVVVPRCGHAAPPARAPPPASRHANSNGASQPSSLPNIQAPTWPASAGL